LKEPQRIKNLNFLKNFIFIEAPHTWTPYIGKEVLMKKDYFHKDLHSDFPASQPAGNIPQYCKYRPDTINRRGIIPKVLRFSVLCLVLFIQSACNMVSIPGGDSSKAESSLTIVSWNVQALFDAEENGTEYQEYAAASGWNKDKYQARLNMLGQAFDKMDETNPDILALLEVENSQVLKDLAQGPLENQGYKWTFFANNPGNSLGLGVLSKYPFEQAKAHSLTYYEETTPRPVLEICIKIQDTPLIIFVCHWKSKLGGDLATEPLRKASARILLRRIREISNDSPETPIVIMGDLNENYDEFYRQTGQYISALLPDDPQAAEIAGYQNNIEEDGTDEDKTDEDNLTNTTIQADYLILSHNKPPKAQYFPQDSIVFYSPWDNELEEGSYNYKNSWETIDHFLLNEALFNQSGWTFDTCKVIKAEPFINTAGIPFLYNPRTGLGLSDHLPLLLKIWIKK
jgi:endonuclease/exonuclease/phosphatase family metal-dependent hydrolase